MGVLGYEQEKFRWPGPVVKSSPVIVKVCEGWFMFDFSSGSQYYYIPSVLLQYYYIPSVLLGKHYSLEGSILMS